MTQKSRPEPVEHHAALQVEYDGAPFYGWTRQPGGYPTIESELIAAFERLTCSRVRLRCAGRTDAGVHATDQVVDARYVGTVPPDRLVHALNGQLPPEISVVRAEVAPEGFDARADATSRAYEYRVLPRRARSPIRAHCVLHHPRALDVDVLHETAAAALGQHEFTAFTPSRSAHAFFARTLVTSRWVERGDELVYEIRGNAFLRHMVRILVGTMLGAARGEATVEEFRAMLAGAPRGDALMTAPPRGLCLVDVTWEPYEGLPLPPGWRAGRAPELREPAHSSPGAVPFSTVG